jgi:Outer membrane lipoprotein carrier protein LolA-like
MTSGQSLCKNSRSCLHAVLVVAACIAIPVSAQTLEVAELLAMLGQVERSTATFEETRFIAALTAPIVRRGTLRYVRPDFLEMVVQSPAPERLEIKGDALTLEARGDVRRLRVSEYPAIAAWIESVRATLAGDQRTLGRHFRIGANGRMAAWMLELIPMDSELAGVVSRIAISGTQAQLTRIEIVERAGDRSVMLITPTQRQP